MPIAPPPRTLAGRIYRRVALALPPAVRRAHGAEMLATFEDELARVRGTDGFVPAVAFVARALLDLVQSGVRERRRRRATPLEGEPDRGPNLLGSLGEDLRGAFRSLRRKPATTAAVIGVLALGTTANVAVFTYVNAFSLAPPGVDVDRLAQVFSVSETDPSLPLSFLDFIDYAEQSAGSFEAMAAVQSSYAASVRHATMTDVAMVEAVSGRFFEVFGVPTVVGRPLQPADDRPGAEPVVVISHRWWRDSFGADPSALGQTVFLNNRPHTLVGVAAPEFLGSLASFRPDVWVPFEPFRARYTNWDAQARNRERLLVRVYGRLRAGVGSRAALDDLSRTAISLDAAYPQERPRRLRVGEATWIDPRTRASEAETVGIMTAAALGLALLVAANVANLLLAAAAGRRREFATRVALGASRRRLLRQLLSEYVLLSVAAGGIAVAVAGPLSARLGSYFASPSVWGANVARVTSVDPRVWLFAIGFALVMGLATGWLPAWRASRERFATVIGRAPDDAGRWTRRRRLDTRGTLVAAQVALAVVLVVVAGLVLRTLDAAAALDPGFEVDRTIAAYVSTSSTTVAEDDRVAFYRDLAERLTEEPWVRSATVAAAAPLSPHPAVPLRPDGRAEAEPTVIALVQPGYFDTLGIAVLRGRDLARTDGPQAPGVALVNEAAAARLFPDGPPLGRRVWRPGDAGERPYEVVGLVADAKIRGFLTPAEPVVYLAAAQHPHSTTGALVVATTGPPAAAVPILERWLRHHETYIAIVNTIPYAEVVRGMLYVQRMNAELFSVLAALGLVLSAVGVFSVMALMVGQRTREIGVRMAIGAQAATVSRMVIRDALVPIVVGVVVGGLVAAGAAGIIRTLLFGVEPTDPIATAGALAVVLTAVVTAAYVPARRAARVDPSLALRAE